MNISEVAQKTGLRPSAIRYYERLGLVQEPPRSSGRRQYSDDVVQRLVLIDIGQRLGFSLEELKALIDTASGTEDARLARQQLMARKMTELDTLIAQAQTMRRLLEESLRCACVEGSDCTEAPKVKANLSRASQLFGGNATRRRGRPRS